MYPSARSLLTASLTLSAATLAAGLAPTAAADTITLVGTIRDFQQSHPDMERSPKAFGHRQGIVRSTLGLDGKPVVDPSFDLGRAMIESSASFDQWFRDAPGVNIAIPFEITLDNNQAEPGGIYTFAREKGMSNGQAYFFPIDGLGWADEGRAADGQMHNFYFTYEVATEFTYTDPAERDYDLTFRFVGDDDVFVFINGQLVVDLGGVHAQIAGDVNVDELAAHLGLEPGGDYELKLFFAERHRTQSNFRIETSLTLAPAPLVTMVSPLFD